MSPLNPQPGFDYAENHNHWSKKIAYSAYSQDQKDLINDLFSEAEALVKKHDLYPNPKRQTRSQLTALRKEHSQELVAKFKHNLTIRGHDKFLSQLCQGVLTYSANLTKSESKSPAPAKVKSEKDEDNKLPPSSAQIGARNLLTDPPDDWALEDFEIDCSPLDAKVAAPPTKMLAENIAVYRYNEALAPKDLRFDKLWTRLLQRNLVSDLLTENLVWRGDGKPFGIRDDEELATAVKWHMKRGLRRMSITIET